MGGAGEGGGRATGGGSKTDKQPCHRATALLCAPCRLNQRAVRRRPHVPWTAVQAASPWGWWEPRSGVRWRAQAELRGLTSLGSPQELHCFRAAQRTSSCVLRRCSHHGSHGTCPRRAEAAVPGRGEPGAGSQSRHVPSLAARRTSPGQRGAARHAPAMRRAYHGRRLRPSRLSAPRLPEARSTQCAQHDSRLSPEHRRDRSCGLPHTGCNSPEALPRAETDRTGGVRGSRV